MSPTERALWDRVQRRARGLSPDLATAILRAFRLLRASMTDAEIARYILSGAVDELLDDLLGDPRFNAATSHVRARLRVGVELATERFASDLPRSINPPSEPVIAFDILNPRVIDAVRELETRVITTLREDIRGSVRQHVQAGLEAGQPPRVVARGLRDVIGLAPTQEEYVRSFRRKLKGDGNPLENKLRDRRFDALIKKGNLTEPQIDKMVEAYRRRFVAHNAETNARTAALDAQRLGQRLSWEHAIENGLVEREHLTKTWRGVMDDRERPSHVVMEGQTVPFDQPFSNGQMIPGENEFNCRCVAIYRTRVA